MLPASLFIIAQIVYAAFILGVSAQPKILQRAKHEVKNVLGVSMLAQDTTPLPDTVAPPANQPPPAEPPPPESSSVAPPSAPDTPQPPSPKDSSQPEPSGIAPSSAPALSEAPSPAASSQTESVSVSPTSEETPTFLPSTVPENTGLETPSPTIAPLESSFLQTEAVLNPENVVNDTEHIDKTSIDEVKKEEDSISQAQTSDEKAKLFIAFAQDKMNDIEKNLKQDDFATTAFATIRLTDMIDRTTQEIQSAPAAQSAELTQKVSDFCQQADLALRNQELVVPEASEEDIEISRAKCFEYR